jgi:hypothetical protein
MSKPPKRRLYVKLNSFMWRERGQNIVLIGSFLLMILLGILASLAAPFLIHLQDNWTADERLPGTAIEEEHQEPN